MKDNIGLRAGVLDDQSILEKPPAIEVFVERRPRVSKPPPWHCPFPLARVRIRSLCRLVRQINPFSPQAQVPTTSRRTTADLYESTLVDKAY